MFLIYDVATGKPRMTVSSQAIADANLEEGEAHLQMTEEERALVDIQVVSGKIMPLDLPEFDPVSYARDLRTGFLADTDWTQAADSPLSTEVKAAWASYRQELRNFPAMVAEIAAHEELAGNVGSEFYVEQLLPEPPSGE
jgi:hypothetical protein